MSYLKSLLSDPYQIVIDYLSREGIKVDRKSDDDPNYSPLTEEIRGIEFADGYFLCLWPRGYDFYQLFFSILSIPIEPIKEPLLTDNLSEWKIKTDTTSRIAAIFQMASKLMAVVSDEGNLIIRNPVSHLITNLSHVGINCKVTTDFMSYYERDDLKVGFRTRQPGLTLCHIIEFDEFRLLLQSPKNKPLINRDIRLIPGRIDQNHLWLEVLIVYLELRDIGTDKLLNGDIVAIFNDRKQSREFIYDGKYLIDIGCRMGYRDSLPRGFNVLVENIPNTNTPIPLDYWSCIVGKNRNLQTDTKLFEILDIILDLPPTKYSERRNLFPGEPLFGIIVTSYQDKRYYFSFGYWGRFIPDELFRNFFQGGPFKPLNTFSPEVKFDPDIKYDTKDAKFPTYFVGWIDSPNDEKYGEYLKRCRSVIGKFSHSVSIVVDYFLQSNRPIESTKSKKPSIRY